MTNKVKGNVKSGNLKKRIINCWQLYLLLLLPVTYLIIFQYIPMMGLQIAYKDFNPNLGIWHSPWVGLKYIQRFFNNNQFARLIRNTLVVSIYSLLCSFPIAIVLALCLT